MLIVFVAEVWVVVKVIGSSVSAPSFTKRLYNVTIAESTPRHTTFLTVTAQSHPTGKCNYFNVQGYVLGSVCLFWLVGLQFLI